MFTEQQDLQPKKVVVNEAPWCLLEELDETLLQAHVLPLLNDQDKKSFRLSCRRAREFLNAEVKEVTITPDTLPSNYEGFFGCRFPNLRTLRARDGSSPLTDCLLVGFLCDSGEVLSHLAVLDLKQCHYVSSFSLSFFQSCCGQLRVLSPSRWTDNCSLWDYAVFTGLEELYLGDTEVDVMAIDDVAMYAVARLSKLRHLSLRRCRLVGDGACDILATMTHLESLDLSSTGVTGAGIRNLKACSRLTSLNLSDCKGITDGALVDVAQLGALIHLDLRQTSVTNMGLAHLSALDRLHHLDLGNRFEVDDSGLRALSVLPCLGRLLAGSFNLFRPHGVGFHHLKHLHFGGIFANRGLDKLFPLPVLETLYIQGIDAVTDAVMLHVSSQTSLQQLVLSGGYMLTHRGLHALRSLSQLLCMTLSACPHITRDCVDEFLGLHGCLPRLVVSSCPRVSPKQEALVVARGSHLTCCLG